MTVELTEVADGIVLASKPLDEDVLVRAALLLGEEFSLLVDTLARPEDMEPLQAVIAGRGRPLLVVNSHCHWDHTWGNCAFPAGTPIIGHRLCREIMLTAEYADDLRERQEAKPGEYEGVAIVPPSLTFEGQLTIDLGGLTAEVHHLPGHCEDNCWVYVPERRFLFAADEAEDPFPIFNSGPLQTWIDGLRDWASRDLDTVVPAHGAISGPDLLTRNADYLEGLLTDNPDPASGIPSFYANVHAHNLTTVQRLGATGTAPTVGV